MEDELVEIARFNYEAEAYTLATLLQSEGIECTISTDIVARGMTACEATGGVRVKILSSDVDRALTIMKEGGYEIPEENVSPYEDVSGFTSKIPFLKRYPLEKRIIILLVVIAVLLALLIFLTSLIS